MRPDAGGELRLLGPEGLSWVGEAMAMAESSQGRGEHCPAEKGAHLESRGGDARQLQLFCLSWMRRLRLPWSQLSDRPLHAQKLG